MRESRPRILLLDDDSDDRALAKLVLEHGVPELAVEEITDAPAFAQACGRRSFALAVLKEDWPEVPVILFTSLGNEELAIRALRLGVDDYLVKKPATFLRLPLAVRSALDKGRSRTSASASAAPLESLLDRAQMAVFSATAEGRLLNASPGFLQILGAAGLEEATRLDLRPLLSAA